MRYLFSFMTLFFLIVEISNAKIRNERGWQRHSTKMSESLMGFINEAENHNMKVNEIIVMQHGNPLAEWHAKGNSAVISVDQGEISGTITAIAIGLAINEGLLKLDDSVISFFPDRLSARKKENLKDMTVRHLLTMTTGHGQDITYDEKTDWVEAFISYPLPYKPGTYFCHERMAGYMLSAILQRVSGEKIIDYLRPRLFEPLGITSAEWQESPQGINTGGWGLRIANQDLARIGNMFLMNGRWNGKRIVPKKWIKQMIRYQTESCPKGVAFKDLVQSGLNSYENDWIQGYGYQIWHSRLGEFMRSEDNRGKMLLVNHKYDAVVVIDVDTENMQTELDLIFHHISPALPEWHGKKEKKHRTGTSPHLYRM